jgi:hypothetical protein
MAKYKIYIMDNKVNVSYPILTDCKDVFDLMQWLNGYVMRYDVDILSGEVQDNLGNKIGDVHFLPVEIEYKYFYETPSARLLGHYYEHEEVGT